MLSAILWALIGGTVLGLLGKMVAPGDRDHVPLWLTILCGIGGGLLGTWLYGEVYGPAGTPRRRLVAARLAGRRRRGPGDGGRHHHRAAPTPPHPAGDGRPVIRPTVIRQRGRARSSAPRGAR